MLHSAWVNEDTVSRKAYIMTWMPAGVPGFLERSRESSRWRPAQNQTAERLPAIETLAVPTYTQVCTRKLMIVHSETHLLTAGPALQMEIRAGIEGMRDYHAKLRANLAKQLPSRVHIVEEQFCHAVSEYLVCSKVEGVMCTQRTLLAADLVPLNGCRYGHKGGEFWPEMFIPLPARVDAKL